MRIECKRDDDWQRGRWAWDAYKRFLLAAEPAAAGKVPDFEECSEKSQDIWVETVDAILHQFGPK